MSEFDGDLYEPVVVESPYAGDVERNVAYARACMADCLRRGEAPYASHLLYTQPGVLRDEVPAERVAGIAAGFAWRRVARKTVVYTDLGISAGMQAGIDDAEDAGRPVEMRSLERTATGVSDVLRLSKAFGFDRWSAPAGPPRPPPPRSRWRGHEIAGQEAGGFVYVDTGESVRANPGRPCGSCGLANRPDGHDACVGSVPGVTAACCGHGDIAAAYVLLSNGDRLEGRGALAALAARRNDR